MKHGFGVYVLGSLFSVSLMENVSQIHYLPYFFGHVLWYWESNVICNQFRSLSLKLYGVQANFQHISGF